ncbi:MAG: Eco57I restriction-modification methylase domain-containing protein [Chthoniobacteraceae bacterium]
MLDLLCSTPALEAALAELSRSGNEARGAIFTRRAVVDFILDLSGYTSDQDLAKLRLLEPSVGEGDFLLPAVERLLASLHGVNEVTDDLKHAIRSVEVHSETCGKTREKVKTLLVENGFSETDALELALAWVIEGDFLLTFLGGSFTHVVGNPPYVRQESISPVLLAEYRDRFSTMYDRADLYVPFIEKGLNSLEPGGVLCFICADRWMKNKYGSALRRMISERFHLMAYVDMVNTDAFLSDVLAYPAITLIKREPKSVTYVAHRPVVEARALSELVPALQGRSNHPSVQRVDEVADDEEPWILQGLDQVSIVRRLESELPTLEEAGCKVGIGVATGADKVYVSDYNELPVEEDRKLPLAVTKDIIGDNVEWTGKGVVNPFSEDGQLVDLDKYPKLKAYFEMHAGILRRRNCAQRDERRWYRTIDKITSSLTRRPKLLIPDIKGKAHVVYESGKLYPHHNLYFITSDIWDLHALQAVLRSGIAALFVSTYSVQMAGGFLRFQAQYLRRIRIPFWNSVPLKIQEQLISAGRNGDQSMANEAVFELYRLTSEERIWLGH